MIVHTSNPSPALTMHNVIRHQASKDSFKLGEAAMKYMDVMGGVNQATNSSNSSRGIENETILG